jgi:uncharacterized membrane protein
VIARLAGLALLGGLAAWVVDAWLRHRTPDGDVPPIRSLAVIDAPIERVWAELVDIEAQPRWMHDMKAVRMADDGPLRVGSKGEATVRMYGVSVTDPVTITVLEPRASFALSHEGLVSGDGIFRLEPGADGTTTIVRWDERLVLPVLPHLGAVLAAPVFRGVFQRDLERFTAIVEASA